MHRFFCSGTNLNAGSAQLTNKSELHHLSRVLRLKKGDLVHLFNEKGEAASGPILSIQKDSVTVQIDQYIKGNHNKKHIIVLACALPKKSKFELIIEKCTELGVDEIIPVITKRTAVKLDEKRLEKKRQRFTTVSINATKQSKRQTIPYIHPVTKFEKIFDVLTIDAVLIIPCLAGERESLLQTLQKIREPARIIFFIGPEGDFTPEELSLAINHGCLPVTLGTTTLKVDTAAITVCAAAQLLNE